MEDSFQSHPHRISFVLYIFLATLALLIDFSFGLIPILGFMIGFIFCLIVSLMLHFFSKKTWPLMRFLAVSISLSLEFLFAVPPTNFIFVCLEYAINLWRTRKRSVSEDDEGSDETEYFEEVVRLQKKVVNDNRKMRRGSRGRRVA